MQSQCIYIHNIIRLLNVIISNLPSNYKISILTNDFFFNNYTYDFIVASFKPVLELTGINIIYVL